MIRIYGAVLLVTSCAGFGFSLAAEKRRETVMLRSLIAAVQEMEWELKYRMTTLPDLCRIAADVSKGALKEVFCELADKLDKREVTEISGCVNASLNRQRLPKRIKKNMRQLGRCLGRFDLEGQVQGLQSIRHQCRKDLQVMEQNCTEHLRNYQTLAICAGAILAILLF